MENCVLCKVADPHHFNADPDPIFSLQCRLGSNYWSIDPPGIHFELLRLHCERPRASTAPSGSFKDPKF
jgi:hypothetical protein